MKNLGYKNLHIVSPTRFFQLSSIRMTRGSEDLLESAMHHETVDEAMTGYHVSFATSHRMRQDVAIGLFEAARLIAEQAKNGKVAILFGSEKYGLARRDIDRSGYVIKLPVEPDFPSVNLAHAVAMVCLQVKMQLIPKADSNDAAQKPPEKMHLTLDERARFYREMGSLFARFGFDTPSVYYKIQNLFERANITEWERNLFYGLIKEVRGSLDD